MQTYDRRIWPDSCNSETGSTGSDATCKEKRLMRRSTAMLAGCSDGGAGRRRDRRRPGAGGPDPGRRQLCRPAGAGARCDGRDWPLPTPPTSRPRIWNWRRIIRMAVRTTTIITTIIIITITTAVAGTVRTATIGLAGNGCCVRYIIIITTTTTTITTTATDILPGRFSPAGQSVNHHPGSCARTIVIEKGGSVTGPCVSNCRGGSLRVGCPAGPAACQRYCAAPYWNIS